MKSGFKMRSGNASSFKMMGSSPAKVDEKTNNLTKKPVGPIASEKEVKEEKPKVPTNYDGEGFDTRKIDPGFEDPLKIQKLQRMGLTPDSQKFSKKAKENEENAK